MKRNLILVNLWILTACTALSPTSPASNLSTTMTPSETPALTLSSTPTITHTLEAETPAVSSANYLLFYTDGVGLYTDPPLSIMNRPEWQSLYADINQFEGFVPYLLNDLAPQMSPNETLLVIPGPDTTWLLNLEQGSIQSLVDKPVVVTWQPTGDYLAYTDDNALDILDLASTPASPEIHFQRPGSLSFASWSPEGNWIAVVEETGEGGPDAYLYNLWLVAPDTGDSRLLEQVPLPATELTTANVLQWAPNGKLLWVGTADQLIQINDHLAQRGQFLTTEGTNVPVSDLPEPSWLFYQQGFWKLSPSGKQQVIIAGEDRNELYLYDLAANEKQQLATFDDPITQIHWSPDGQSVIFNLGEWSPDQLPLIAEFTIDTKTLQLLPNKGLLIDVVSLP